MRETPQIGWLYKHFKGEVYKIIGISIDSETLKEYVVYTNVNGSDKKFWHREIKEFLDYVDKEKYPNVEATWRFDLFKR